MGHCFSKTADFCRKAVASVKENQVRKAGFICYPIRIIEHLRSVFDFVKVNRNLYFFKSQTQYYKIVLIIFSNQGQDSSDTHNFTFLNLLTLMQFFNDGNHLDA